MSSNKEAAIQAFQERKGAQAAARTGVTNAPLNANASVRSPREEQRSFIGLCKILNPGGNSSKAVPNWVMNLENELDTADTFWR